MKEQTPKGHLSFDIAANEPENDLIIDKNHTPFPKKINTTPYYESLLDFDPEDPGAVVEQEAKSPIFSYKPPLKNAA